MTIDVGFFGFREHPFNPTPDPRFLCLTPSYQEALAQLLYGVQARKGFILLTGEVGTGKTTLVHALLDRLEPTTAVALVTNTLLGFDGILEYMLEDLGVAKPGETRTQRIFALQNFLVERGLAGQNTVLILDEAQDLDLHTLEQIRLLSNFETRTEKILQILLVGQPELRAKLDLPQVRQLKQRIGLRSTIPPLTAGQVRDYIRTRLRVAGARDLGLFSPGAIVRIARYSGGVPRVVNTVCDHSLLFAYAEQVRVIDRDLVDQAIQYLDEGERPRWRAGRLFRRWRMTPLRWTSLVASAAAMAGLAALTARHPATVWQALDIAASSVPDLARALRALLPL